MAGRITVTATDHQILAHLAHLVHPDHLEDHPMATTEMTATTEMPLTTL